MAGETEEHLNTDSLREDGIMAVLPDGRLIISGGGGLSGKWFVLGKDGEPDWDQPVDIYKEFNLEQPPDRSP